MTYAEIAERLGVDPQMVRNRLRRFQRMHPQCAVEISDRRPRECGFLYRVERIQPVLQKLIERSNRAQPSDQQAPT